MKSKRIRRRMLIVVGSVVGVVVAAFAVMYAIGARLPVGHVASVSKTIDAPPDQVWEALTDIEAMPSWRKELISINRLDSQGGLPRWVEKSKFGEIPLQVEVMEEAKTLVTRIDGKGLPFGGKWTWTLKPAGAKTELTVREDGEVYSPMFRFMSKHIFGHSKTLETYVDQLAAKFAKETK